MKVAGILAWALAPLLFTGCLSEPLSIETHGEQMAAALGVSSQEIQFLSEADIANLKELKSGFSDATKGIVAITETDVDWGRGTIESVRIEEMRGLPWAQIEGATEDGDVVQLKISDGLLVIRPHSLSAYEGAQELSVELLARLPDHDTAPFVVMQSFSTPAHDSTLYARASEADQESYPNHGLDPSDPRWSLHATQR